MHAEEIDRSARADAESRSQLPVAETPGARRVRRRKAKRRSGSGETRGTQAAEPTPEQTAVMVDLHWLIHQGAVLEFADGRMETAKKPAPKPPKPEKKDEKPAEGEAAVATEPAAQTEIDSSDRNCSGCRSHGSG